MAVELSQPPKRKNISRSEIWSEGKKEKLKNLNEYSPMNFLEAEQMVDDVMPKKIYSQNSIIKAELRGKFNYLAGSILKKYVRLVIISPHTFHEG